MSQNTSEYGSISVSDPGIKREGRGVKEGNCGR